MNATRRSESFAMWLKSGGRKQWLQRLANLM
jgi:antibiotic biosynthesis monooxygenase (ABM) superfamily enzyme